MKNDMYMMDTGALYEGDYMMSQETETTTEVTVDSLLSNWYFVGGVSGGMLLLSVVIGLLLAKSKIKKGFDVYED
jgi:hypothetical protein